MADVLGGDTLKVLYRTQRDILASAKDSDSLLTILSRAAHELSGQSGFAVLFYDVASKQTRVRFSEGFDAVSLSTHCKSFTASRLGNLPVASEIVSTLEGVRRYFIPIGDALLPFGALILPAADSGITISGIDEFREIAADAIGRFMEVELVKLQMAELATLLEVGKAISSTLDLNDLLRKIMQMATKVMRCETSTVYLVDRQTNELYFHIVQGDPNVGSKLQEIRLPMGTGLAGWCAKESKPVIVPDTAKDPRFFKGADKKSGFVTRSMICVPMRLKDEVIGVLQVLNRTGDIPFNDHDTEILEALGNQAVSAIDNARLYENIQKVYLATIEVLATAIDAKDPYTQGHSRRVTQYSVAIAEEINMERKMIDSVRYAGLLHDVGKIGIKDSIIRKPARLTDEEYAIIKKHPEIGAKILRPVDFLADKVPGVKHHHEYFDGRGYPDHLKGDDIPLIARIICVADAFDAMTTNRPYRKGLSFNTAVAELRKFSGKQFDPMCVDAFLKAFEKKLFQYFEKVGDTGDMILKQDDTEITEETAVPGFIQGVPLESQPYPPMMAFGSTPSSQPYPPIIPEGNEPPGMIRTAPPANGGSAGTPSSQPFPPVGTQDSTKPPNGEGGK
ncbi:MAG TPA: HD domain-containing protein [Candidatus Ozemobacteraceae bacterium]|nr:HD domain-containing protein [Candidatus Ozemobacteraceae bacterium]